MFNGGINSCYKTAIFAKVIAITKKEKRRIKQPGTKRRNNKTIKQWRIVFSKLTDGESWNNW
jgi:ribosomal protein S26